MIQPVEGGDQRALLLPGEDALARQHPRVGAVDIQQRIEKIALARLRNFA